jgi:hypothetical protein
MKMPTSFGAIGFGANIKHLTGYEAFYLESINGWQHTKLKDDQISVENVKGNYGVTTSNFKSGGPERSANGRGIGLDLGFMATISDYDDEYRWRFGVSILDIGGIKFDKNAQAHVIQDVSKFELDLRDFDDFSLPEESQALLQHFSSEALGDANASKMADEFKLALPTAISLQGDYYFGENIYLNAFLIHRLPTASVGPKRTTLLALTPRYEHKWFSVSMPVSVLHWQKTQVGLAARLGYLVIGSDKVGSLFGKSDYSGTDFYIALKLNQLRIGSLGEGGSGKRKYGNGKKAKCYDF